MLSLHKPQQSPQITLQTLYHMLHSILILRACHRQHKPMHIVDSAVFIGAADYAEISCLTVVVERVAV